MRRACLLLVATLVSATPFACSEDFTGGGGLPGDLPGADGDARPSDGARDRSDAPATDALVKDVATDPDTAD